MSARQTNETSDVASSELPGNRSWNIFLVSVLALFLELMLIRWIGTEIRIFAYLQNTVLIVCFLGLGMGCFTCRRGVKLDRLLPPLFCLVAVLAIPLTRKFASGITELLSVLSDLVIWEHGVADGKLAAVGKVSLGLFMTLILMILLWEIFVPLGRMLGRLMDDHPRTIWAYSINIAGSLVGIGLFVGLSVLYMPPFVWCFVVAVMLLWLLRGQRQWAMNLAMVGAMVLAAWLGGNKSESLQVAWSPYQKLDLLDIKQQELAWPGKYLIGVNNAGYQGIIDLSEAGRKSNPRISPDMYGLSQYDIPLLVHPQPKRVLIVGAGAGNDVAGALRGGAEQVIAVEIDPAIIEMGRRYHPERPYDSPRVKIVNDDARSFFATTDEKFELIVFGLLDSHTTTSMTNARLDHYVYTKESIERARSLLAPGGVVSLSFEALKPYIADRMARCIRKVFQQEPLVFRVPHGASGWGGAMFIAGDTEAIQSSLENNPRLAQKIKQWQDERPVQLAGTTEIATDDWPYIYLESRKIPSLYFLLAGLMGGLLIYCKMRLKLKGAFGQWSVSHWHFFFLGAAFLLLEVQNISKAAVVLGNTWLVNAIIISAILSMILAANVIAARWPKLPQNIVTACLIGSCLALYFIDLSRFGFLPYATKATVVGLLATLPMLFAGIVFIRSFAIVERKDLALGANLIGALVGGLLQSVTFVVGIKALLLIVAGLYAAAMLTRPRNSMGKQSKVDKSEADTPDEKELAEPVAV